MESRGLSFRVVFVPGIADGIFPGPIRPDPILSDPERKALGDVIGDRDAMPLQARRPAEEELLFRLAAGAAQEHLILTYPYMEPVTGRPRHPSALVLNLDPESEFRAAQMLVEDFEALDDAEYHLARIKEDKSSAAVCLDQLSPIFRAARQAHTARHLTARLTPYEGALFGQQSREILRRRFSPELQILSPTVLEEYAQCPFRYYLQYILAIKPLEEPEEALTFPARERGLLIHRILRDFYRQILNTCQGPLLPSYVSDYRTLMTTLVDRWCRWQESRGLTGRPMAWELEQERLRDEMEEFIHEEVASADRFVPRYLEVAFPPGAHETTYSELDQSTLKLQLDDQSVLALRGRVDRIDIGEDRISARVMDYKSGEPRRKPDDLHGGRQIQLLIYALAARQMLAPIGVQEVEAQYYYVGSQGRFRRERLSPQDISTMETMLKEILALIIKGILSGLFIPAGEEVACLHCQYRAACGPSRGKVLSTKKHDEALATFHRLREIKK
jgi:ATP-dependent helicase/nuclease subunit B